MTEYGGLLTDAWTSICGALGAMVLLVRLPQLIATPELAWRFRACLRVIIVLMVFRVGHWADWGWSFSVVTFICSALLPLLALLMAEGLMRQHAPKALKLYCGIGAFIFCILALRPSGWLEMTPVFGVLPFQLSAFTWIVVVVLRRDKALLSLAENQALTRVLSSFLLILPFVATDFLSPFTAASPLRLGGIAVLGMCLVMINLYRTSLSQRRIILSMCALFLACIALTIVIDALAGTSFDITFMIGAVTLATMMLLATWQAARALVAEDRNMIILREIAAAPTTGLDAAVAMIRRGADVGDTLCLPECDLGDFDIPALQALFETTPVRGVAMGHNDEQLDWLFRKYEATHVIAISTAPLVLVAFNNPALVTLEDAGYGLAALQRVARQIATSEAP